MEITRRYRIKVARNAKGVWVPECSVEFTATDGLEPPQEFWRQLTLAESNALVAELDKKYPSPKEEK